jgi:hypothetical protein
MIVDPDFPDHWKTRMLVDLLGGDEAGPSYILRIWGHCQLRKQWVFDNLPATALKALCRYPGHPHKLESCLVSSGFLHRDASQVLTVLRWDEYNAQLVANWENGKKGGRPPKPNETHGLPMANPSLLSSPPPAVSLSSKKIPTLEEVKEYCAQRASEGKPRVDPEQFFDFYEANGWVQGARGKPVKDWRACVRTWERSDFRRPARVTTGPVSMGERVRAYEEAKKNAGR